MAKSGTVDFYNGVATQSVRLDDGSSASLSKTISGSPLTWTFSAWVKRSSLGGLNVICASRTVGQLAGYITFQADNKFEVELGTGNGQQTSTLFRDTSAWYHVVVNSTGANGTAKAYINSVEVLSWSPGSDPWLFTDSLDFNCSIGQYGNDQYYYDGYMSEVNFVDGLALNPTYFGETKNGVWIPKEPDVSEYGTNGFRLKFDQVGVGTASTSTIGADTSGKTNHLTSSGIVASDCAMPDSPENNFCVLNYNRTGQVANLTNGALTYKDSNTGGPRASVGTFGATSGKWYFEIRLDNDLYSTMCGFMDVSIYAGSHLATDTNRGSGNLPWDERGYLADNSTLLTGYDYTTNDVVSFAIDIDAGKAFIRKNSDAFLGSGDPSDGSNPAHTFTAGQPMTPFIASYRSAVYTLNCGQDSTFGGQETATTHTDSNGQGTFHTAPPTGYLALCTANLPEPTIGANSLTQADDHFNTALYTGNGGTIDITVGFQPDFSWYKCRAGGTNRWHYLFDSNRGANKALYGNDTYTEDSQTPTFNTQSFQSNGTRIVRDNGDHLNFDGDTYVSWNWKANGGTRTTFAEIGNNPAGGYQANTTAGFSIVDYIGTGDEGTIAHGLGVVPTMMIIKNRDVADAWAVYHGSNTSAPATDYLVLNTTAATVDAATYWADTAPTSSVFTVHDAHNVNADGENYIAYVFADVEGYSKFGSYTGNGNADGAFVYFGFRPAFVMTKRTDTTANWVSVDTAQNPFNVTDAGIQMNTGIAQGTGYANDFLSNGMKIRVSGATVNASGGTYIYMAFAEAPFKYANAR